MSRAFSCQKLSQHQEWTFKIIYKYNKDNLTNSFVENLHM